MKNQAAILTLSAFLLLGLGSAASGDFTGDNTTDSFNIESGSILQDISVNEFGVNLDNVESRYLDNQTQSRSFNISYQGNVSQLLDSPNTVTLFNNESSSFPLVANVPRSQDFGQYNGTLSLTGLENGNFTDSVNVSLNVVDDISPEFNEVSIGSVQATQTVEWNVVTTDNLNTSRVNGTVLREVERTQGNETEVVNETVDSFEFKEDSVDEWSYSFSNTDSNGTYYARVQAFDESNNSVERTESFEVTRLNSVSLNSNNFVFDTIRPKEDTERVLLNNSVDGTEFMVSLDSLSYDGNESVEIGLVPPGGESPEIVGVGEERSFSSEGVYRVVLLHSGNDEIKGTHRVNGRLVVSKPSVHVRPLSEDVSFSGTVKNLDKPPEICQRVKEFDSCIAYSLDQSRSLFEGEYGIQDENSSDYAYLLGRIPTESVEGSSEWGDEASLTFGQYNKTIERNNELDKRVESLESSKSTWRLAFFVSIFLFPGIGGLLFVWYLKIGQYVSFAQSKRKIIEKASVVKPDEGLN